MKGTSVRKNIIYIIIAVLIATGVLVYSQYSNLLGYTSSRVESAEPSEAQGTQQPSQTEQQTQTPQQQTQPETQTIAGTVATVREFTVHGKSFEFDSKTIAVNKGDRVKITFISDDVSHDICVEGYGCSQVISKGETTTLEFVAKEEGKLKFYCSVDGHRQFGMEGDLIIQ